MSLARRADPQILSSTRERTDCISSLAIHVDLEDLSQPSRLVSLHKSERDADSKVKGLIARTSWGSGVSNLGLGMHIEHWLGGSGRTAHLVDMLKKHAHIRAAVQETKSCEQCQDRPLKLKLVVLVGITTEQKCKIL